MKAIPLDEEAIYHLARRIVDAEVRNAYLRQVCGDDSAFRDRLDALLRVCEQESSFLESPAVGSPPATAVAVVARLPECPGTLIGPYKLLEQIGEGGMGVVYMAEQTVPVRRRVALKIIKPGMDTRQVIARFEAERQALALLDHPNIAKIFDGGVTESGRSYFVMELVKGLPITEFCDRNRLTPRQRLKLFLPVCQAVQHAHQKGIIHRDLKPSNVLVSMHDATPVVRVIDFGVAKAIGQELTEKTLFTGFAQMIGTPLYMSPEQAGQSALGTDTRSDIYTLGVLLYELLAGTTPFDQERFRKAAYDEICRIIREEVPPMPSTRLSELGAALSTVSTQRDTEPVKLTRLVRGELDWIVMKSLEKDRNRRYESASGLADDVARYLRDEPVQACPPSATYKLRKLARKHRAGLATAAVFVLLLVAATSVSVSLAMQADRERARAVKAEKLATAQQRHERARADELAASLAENVYVADIQYARGLWERGALENCWAILSQYGPLDEDKKPRRFEGRYLWDLAASSPTRGTCYRGHQGIVYHSTFSPDALTVASGGEDRDIHLWNAASGMSKAKIKAHTDDVNWLAFSPDGKVLASASDDATIRLWDVATQGALAVLRGHTGPVESIAFSPDGRTLVSGGKDGIVRLWDIAKAQLLKALKGHSQNIECVAYAPDGKSVVSGSFDGTVKIWDVADEREPLTIRASAGRVMGVAISPDGSMVASGDQSGAAAIFDASTGRQRANFKSHGGPTRGVCFSADNRCLASCGDDGRVQVWLCGLEENRSSFVAGDRVWSLSFSRDGHSLVTNSSDGAVRIWNWPASGPVQFVRESRGVSANLAMAPDGRSLAIYVPTFRESGLHETRILLLDCTNQELIDKIPIEEGPWPAYAWSPDSQSLAYTKADRSIWLWDRATQESRLLASSLVPLPRGWFTDSAELALAFTSDGRNLGMVGSDNSLRCLDLVTKTEKVIDRSDDQRPRGVWALDGSILALTSFWGIRSWDLGKMQETGPSLAVPRSEVAASTFLVRQRAISSSAVSLDQQWVALGLYSGRIDLFHLRTGARGSRYLGHRDLVTALAFSPDGKTLASCSPDGTVRLWNNATGLEIMIVENRKGRWINSVAFGLGGKMLAIAGSPLDDGTTVTLHYADSSLITEARSQSRRPPAVSRDIVVPKSNSRLARRTEANR